MFKYIYLFCNAFSTNLADRFGEQIWAPDGISPDASQDAAQENFLAVRSVVPRANFQAFKEQPLKRSKTGVSL